MLFKSILFFAVFSFNSFVFARSFENVNDKGVAIKGYDPVSYFKSSQPSKGDEKFKAVHQGVTYLFSSEANKAEFLKTPDKYLPQFGGWCAYAVAESKEKVEIDPQAFVIQDGRLLLFYNGLWGDTRKKWLTTKNKDPKSFLKEADVNWPETKNKEP